MEQRFDHKIIIVEDSDFARAILVGKLKKNGFDNLAFPSTSVEAWEQIAEAQLSDHPFDLVITDLNMPDLDGLDLLEKIKDDPLSKSLKVMVVSADADKTIIKIALSMGASAYITKPFEEDELIFTVQDMLGIEPNKILKQA